MSTRRIPAVGRTSNEIRQDLVFGTVPGPAPKLILAEGDSWFSLFVGKINNLSGGTNFLNHISTTKASAIIDLSYHGDNLQDIAASPQKETFREIIHDDRYGFHFQLILLSVGGNDVISNLNRIIKKPQVKDYQLADCLKPEEITKLLNEMEKNLLALVKLRDNSKINKLCPILVHTYDYITPRNLATSFLIKLKGPWAYSALRPLGITNPLIQKEITDYLLREFSERLHALALRVANFHVAPTLGTLTPAAAEDLTAKKDWADEIHPSPAGFKKLATRVVNPLIDQLLA